ncbi:MAG: NUDIX domain-containing protein [bacterium]|nr:NUDIX domain-containing protein [bacterium]
MITCEFEDHGRAKLRHVTVGVLVVKDNQILLGLRGTYHGRPILESGKWGPLGGYMERDENLAGTARREVMEESGWEIANLKLLRINDNPNRPAEDRQNVDMIFMAEAVRQVGTGDEEVAELKWFDLDNLPPREQIAFDHADNFELYKKYRQERFDLPVIG